MRFPRRHFLHLAAGAAALPTVSRIAWAQAYPTRPVRMIVPFPAGGSTDILARLIGQWLSERLAQPFLVESRPGATGNIGTEAVVRAPADGYTLLLATTTNVVNATVYDKPIFNFTRDTGSSCSAPRKWRINAKRAASRIATEHNAVPVWTSSHSPKPAGLRYQGLGVPNTSGPLRARTSIERQS
jgi:hypothetical protein